MHEKGSESHADVAVGANVRMREAVTKAMVVQRNAICVTVERLQAMDANVPVLCQSATIVGQNVTPSKQRAH
ncbi:hypothetical protein ERJ75_001582900 [Trypanosoma vivax]|nr:hypothetical protein ERJ75_001582900 [Trypanosoma vivax]